MSDQIIELAMEFAELTKKKREAEKVVKSFNEDLRELEQKIFKLNDGLELPRISLPSGS